MDKPLDPSSAPETLAAHDRRLTDLEVKACYGEDLLEHLNRQVARQQDQIDLLLEEVRRLRQQAAEAPAGGFRSLRDELPPHY